MSPSSSDDGSSFLITSSILICAFTFIAFFQSRLPRVDLSFSLRAMTLKICLLICRKTYVSDWLLNCMRLCVGSTAFAHVCVRICVGCTDFLYVCVHILRVKRIVHTYTDFRRLYDISALSGLCVCIRIFHIKRRVRTDTAFAHVYNFFALNGLCVLIRLLRVKRLVRTYTTFAC